MSNSNLSNKIWHRYILLLEIPCPLVRLFIRSYPTISTPSNLDNGEEDEDENENDASADAKKREKDNNNDNNHKNGKEEDR